MKRARWFELGAVLAALAVTREASANGRYPASGQIALSPSNEETLIVRATYGILFSTDGGMSWGWVCEPAVGYGGEEDPMMAFTADGTVLAGIFEGLSIGSTDACSWSFWGGGLANKFVVDLAIDKVTPTSGVLVISNSAAPSDGGTPLFLTQLWQTSDNAKTWTQAGVNLPPVFLGLTVESAPSRPQRVYISGIGAPPNEPGTLERSDDRGATWQALPIVGSDMNHLPYIGAVDPQNPDIVYVRLDSDSGDSLLVTKDGGTTWSTILSVPGKLAGFALSPDGQTVAVGSPGVTVDGGTATTGGGIWTAPASTLAFTHVSSVGALCLTWGASGLYACADEFTDKFTAGVSLDQGKTFTPILHLGGLCGPLACGASTTVGQQCAAQWPPVQASINASCPTDGGSSASSTTTGGPSSSSGIRIPTQPPTNASGCSCSLSAERASGAALVSLAAVGALVGARGRKRPRKTQR